MRAIIEKPLEHIRTPQAATVAFSAACFAFVNWLY